MSAKCWILLTLTAGTILACCFWHQIHKQARADEASSSTKQQANNTPSPAPDQDVAEAQALLKSFREARKTGALVANRKLSTEEAIAVGGQLRKIFPYQSLKDRLHYEMHRRPRFDASRLSPEASERLDRSDAQFTLWSGRGPFGSMRAKSLEKLHSDQVAQFISREGFGISRMPTPSPGLLELPPAPTIPFAVAPERPAETVAEAAPSLPKQVTKYDLARLHAGEPLWTDEDVERKYYDKMRYDEKMKAMFDTYSTWKAKHNPWELPSRKLIFDSHDSAVLNFAGGDRNGHVKDIDHVAGFGSHAMTSTPRFEPGPIELQYWPQAGQQNPPHWLVTQLQLVTLLKHDLPGVYVSSNLPKMEELEGAKVRPLNEFEATSLQRLSDGEHVAVDVRANHIRMLGAVRASKQCLQCHQVDRGELLGAFSYELTRAKLNVPQQGHESAERTSKPD